MFCGLTIRNLKDISKKGSSLSANAQHDVTDFTLRRMFSRMEHESSMK